MTDFDKFHDECGVVAIYGHPEAAKLAYLGLYALQHRGQESAGIVASDGATSAPAQGHGRRSRRSSPQTCWRSCPARWPSATRAIPRPAIRRCSTRSRSWCDCNKGKIALAHNGNLTNAGELRGASWKRRLHLPDHQRHRSHRAPGGALASEQTLPGALARRAAPGGRRVFAGVADARPRSSPCAIRAASARWPWDGFRRRRLTRDTIVFASETCAFDLIGARLRARRRSPAKCVIVGPEGVHSRFYSPRSRSNRAAFSSTSISRGRTAWSSAARCRKPRRCWAACWRANRRWMPTSSCPCPTPACPRPSAMPPNRHSVPLGPDPQSLRRPHVHRAGAGIRDFGVKLKLNPVRSLLEGKRVVLVDDSIVRGTTSRKIVRMVREAGANEVHVRISCPPTISPCYLRRGYADQERADRRQQYVEEIREFIGADSLAYLSLEGLAQGLRLKARRPTTARPATPATIRRTGSMWTRSSQPSRSGSKEFS